VRKAKKPKRQEGSEGRSATVPFGKRRKKKENPPSEPPQDITFSQGSSTIPLIGAKRAVREFDDDSTEIQTPVGFE